MSELKEAQFQSERFLFVPIEQTDESLMIELYSHPLVMKKIMAVKTAQEVVLLLQHILDKRLYQPAVFWKIQCKTTEQTLGIQGFLAEKKPSVQKQAEFGIMLMPDWHSKGVASEAVEAMLGYGFTTLSLYKAFAHYRSDNKPIAQIAKRLGFAITAVNSERSQYRCETTREQFFKQNGA